MLTYLSIALIVLGDNGFSLFFVDFVLKLNSINIIYNIFFILYIYKCVL